MNNFTGLGRLVKDIELAYTPTGTAVGKSSIAINRPFKNKETGEYDADFINIVAFGKTAEVMANHLQKGNRVGVEGRIQSGSYTNKDGVKVYTTDLIVESFHFVDSKQQTPGNTMQHQTPGNTMQHQTPGNTMQQAPQQNYGQAPNPIAQQGAPIDDSDLPF